MRFGFPGVAFMGAVLTALALFAPAAAQAGESECPVGMECRTVAVPLDWSGKRKGKINLDVRVGEGSGPMLLYLFGGPGQGGADYAASIRDVFAKIAPDYRVAVFDQRGTGGTAIHCDRLQRRVLTDFTVRPRKAVRECARSLGSRRSSYSTTSTVRDIEAIRRAIGVKRMAVMGASYGTYVATRYARAFPDRVSRLILDSVVPQEDVDPMLRVHMRRVAKVLRWECVGGRCGPQADPAADLARLVRMPAHRGRVPGSNLRLRVDGPALLDWATTIMSFIPREIPAFARGIHRAVHGDYRPLLRAAGRARQMTGIQPARSLSWGLHAATICTDLAFPFSIGEGNRKSRIAAARYLSGQRSRAFWPFDAATARGNGIVQACADWPQTRVAAPPRPGRIRQPTLLLAGQYDISTPVEYARRELRRAPRGRLVVVPEAGHAVAFQAQCAAEAVARFLYNDLSRNPCRQRARR